MFLTNEYSSGDCVCLLDSMIFSLLSLFLVTDNDDNQRRPDRSENQHQLYDKHAETASWSVALGQRTEGSASSTLQEKIR